ncbi:MULTISPECIES: YybH family protein [Cupriavidus]|uniref:YybH family protein n=1 Tax=Cupriavidus sp. DF5525 TaxID=3160989 RepID=UPI0032DFBFC7
MATSTGHQSTASAASEQAHAVLRDVERRWNASAREWNVDALTSMYAPEALFFGGRPGHAVGQPEILAYFSSYAGTLLSASMSLVDQTVIELGTDMLLAQGHAKFRFVLADGRETFSELRTTWVLVRRQGVWQILQHHFSPTPEVPPIQ